MKKNDLRNKTAFLSGASQGLGEAFARTLHAAGASFVVSYLDASIYNSYGKFWPESPTSNVKRCQIYDVRSTMNGSAL